MSSDKRKEVNDVDKHDTPDSTTKERVSFYEGEDVFVFNKDGRYYLGTIVKICVSSEKCLVKFGDGAEQWSFFKDLTRLSIPVTEECSVTCVVCKRSQTKKNNDVVVCEKCGRGYHQKCHQPIIDSVKSDWKCKRCRRNKNCQLSVTKKTVIEDLSYDATTNNSSNSESHLGELPPTPPSSLSAPETPQPSIVNGEPPTSPIEETCCDFNDTSTPNQNGVESRCLNLDDLLADNATKANGQQVPTLPPISLPLQLHAVITEPQIRQTKRRLSEKDIRINHKGEVKRRRMRRQSSLGALKTTAEMALLAAAVRPSTSKPTSACATPVKTIPSGSTGAELKSIVYGYFNDETKIEEEAKLDRVVAGEEYRICGKRRTLDGRVQYLVDWVKCTNPL